MKILMLADANSIWTKRFVENVVLRLELDVTLLSSTNISFSDYYSKTSIHVETLYKKAPRRLSFLKKAIGKINLIVKLVFGKYDVVHINFASLSYLKLLSKLRIKKKLIITFWGSDLLRVEKSSLLKCKKAIQASSRIVVMTSDMKDVLLEYFGHNQSNKIEIIDMGISSLDYIDIYREKRSVCRERYLKESVDKISIAVGYNASKSQQHLRIIEELSKLSDALKNKVVLLFVLSYPLNSQEYISLIKEKLDKSQISYLTFNNFLDDEQMAQLFLSTDIFINGQTTDALSSSMLELLYSGSTIINGTWLRYTYLDSIMAKTYKFCSFDELGNLLRNIIENSSFQANSKVVFERIKQDYGWEKSSNEWKKLIDSL